MVCTFIAKLLIRKYWTWTGFRFKQSLGSQKESKDLELENKEIKDFQPTSCNGFSNCNELSQCNGVCHSEIHVEGGKSPANNLPAEPCHFIDSGVNLSLPKRSQRRNSKLIRVNGNLCLDEPSQFPESRVHLPLPVRPQRKLSRQEHFNGNVSSEGTDSFESHSSAYEGDVSATSSFNMSGVDTKGSFRRADYSHWKKQSANCSRETSIPEDGIVDLLHVANYRKVKVTGEGENRKKLLKRLTDRLQETRFYSTESSASSRASSRRQSLQHSFRGSLKHLKRSKTETDFSTAGDQGLGSENLVSYSTEYTENESDIEKGNLRVERQTSQKFGVLRIAIMAFRSSSTGSSQDTALDSDM